MNNQQEITLIVGIGASAGGLAVLKEFVRALPERPGMTFIVIQHLDPNHKSLLGELLNRESILPVEEIQQGQPIGINCIYVIPPDSYLEVHNGVFKLTPMPPQRGARKAIDHCFRSLAREYGAHCAGIVLSGAGNDGTAGLRAIKASGGLSLAQLPHSAQYRSMPLSAVEAHVIDKALAVHEMPALLLDYKNRFFSFSEQVVISDKAVPAQDRAAENAKISLSDIAKILQNKEKFNIQQYKPGTILRRIARRMSLTSVDSYGDYLQLLSSSDYERRRLTQDLLINVTDFFRDAPAFALLETQIIPEIVQQTPPGEEIRVWSCGCASGEEAYSIAILLLEALKKGQRDNAIQIFATDIDEHAIAIARRGIYPDSIAREVPADYLERYFLKMKDEPSYRISASVRDVISFASQNAISDPPFSRMQLVCCRNLLIYLRPEAQDRVLDAFYFALNRGGYLFLGSSETVGSKQTCFSTVSKKWRIYQKITDTCSQAMSLPRSGQKIPRQQLQRQAAGEIRGGAVGSSRADRWRNAMLNTFMPPGVVVDHEGRLLYNHGNWKKYLAIVTGEPRYEITQLVLPALRSRLHSALHTVRNTQKPTSFRCRLPVEEVGAPCPPLRVELAPLRHPDKEHVDAIGILFIEESVETDAAPQEAEVEAAESSQESQLQQELLETREELQHTIEELETSTEELRASHEEMISTNEELQSANEELEASAEELRSLNEELTTVNVQLREKIDALQKANNDLENFFGSTNIPTLFLDSALRINNFNPAAARLLTLMERDIGCDSATLRSELLDAEALTECREVHQTLQSSSREITSKEGRWYLRQITLYRTEERRIEGVVVAFQEITQLKVLAQRAERREQQQAVVAKLGMLALSGAEPEVIMHQAVREVAHTLDVDFAKVLRYRPKSNDFILVAGVGWPKEVMDHVLVSGDEDSQAGYTLRTHKPVIVERLSDEKRFIGPELLTDYGVISGISCVINHSDPPFGVIGIHTKSYRRFGNDDANFLVSVANFISTALKTRHMLTQLHNSEAQFRTMANTIPQLAWMTDETGYIYWYNQRWYDYTGMPLEQLKGWGWRIVHHPDHVERVVAHISHCVANGKTWEDTFPLRSKSGEYRWFLSRAEPIRGEDGRITHWFGTNTDITDQLAQEQELRQSQERLQMAKDSANIGVYDYDIGNNTIEWDDLLTAIWGLSSEEPVTIETFYRGLHPDDRERTTQAVQRACDPQSDGHYHVIYRVINQRSQQQFWIAANGQVTFEEGRPARMVGIVIDISEQKRIEESLSTAVSELQEMDQKKNEFLSILGHELRNPLAALSNCIEILALQAPDANEVINIMKHSVGTMAKLLDDLLDLNRVSYNKIQLNIAPVEIQPLLERAINATRKLIDEKNHQLICERVEALLLHGDPMRLEQIIGNLIANACKYTPPSGTITLSAEREGELAQIIVQDNGVGLDPAYLEKIFDPFFQVPQEGKAASGLGIGLALSQKLAQMHGGKISVHSEGHGKGSTFILQLPLQTNAALAQPPAEAAAVTAVAPGLRVVLVEDNRDIRTTVLILLENLQCQVKTASDGQEGVRLAREFQPDVMIVDIGLPDISGHEVASQLRAQGFTATLVALSGYSHKEVREKSKLAGFDFHLAKPASLDDLLSVLHRVTQ